MAQEKVWDKEYQRKKLVTGGDEPQGVFVKYIKQLKKSGVKTSNLRALDLGSGTGRNSNYLATLGNTVTGIEISTNAIRIAQERATKMNLKVEYIKESIGNKFPFNDNVFDLVIDITSSNSLNESERLVYLNEIQRVLKSGGYFFVRALLKDGDKNAQNLLKISPGKEKDTYYMEELDLTERVFSRSDFEELYGKYFKIDKLTKTSSYAKVEGKIYKRNYLIAYLKS